MTMKNRKIWFLFAAVIAVLLCLSFLVLRSRTVATGPSEQGKPVTQSTQQVPAVSPSASALAASVAKSDDPESVEELSTLIRESATQGGDLNALFARIVRMQLPKQAWWVNATDFSSLLAVATDTTLGNDGRELALRLYLSGASKSELEQQSATLQGIFPEASEEIVSAIMQGMAAKGVAARSLIETALTDPERSEAIKCTSWNAARATMPADPRLVALAIEASASGASLSSKTALDYLASSPDSAYLGSNPMVQDAAIKLLANAVNLPHDAKKIELANADAAVLAMPQILEQGQVKAALLNLLHNATNPEIRLSALEQLVAQSTKNPSHYAAEIASTKKNLSSLFPDPSTQIRATAYISRAK